MKDHFAITKSILADLLYLEESDIAPDATLASLGADSLDEIEIIMALEHEYGILIPDDAIPITSTIEDIVKYIQSRFP